jgi:ATP-binding cassette, subfamily B, bacterial
MSSDTDTAAAAEPRTLRRRISRYFRLDIYLRLLPYLWPYKLMAAVVIAMAVAASFLSLASPWPMAILIDSGLNGKPLPSWLSWFPFHGTTAVIFLAVFGGVFLKFFRSTLDVVQDYLKTRVNWNMIVRFKCDLFEHLQKVSLTYHDEKPIGDTLYRLEEDTPFISTLIWSNFRHLITSVITFGTMLVVLIGLDWQLTLIALASTPITLAAIARFSNKFRGRSKAIKAISAAAQTIAQEVLSGIRVVKAFGQESREQQRYREKNQAWITSSLRLRVQDEVLSLGLQLVGNLNRAIILVVGAFHVRDGRLTIGELLVILSYVDSLYTPIQGFTDVMTNMQMSLASGERVIEVMNVEPEVENRSDARTLERVVGAVSFEKVDFAYGDGAPVLHDVSFVAAAGDVIAIVGPTGAGKTTIASLIVRFYDPASGRVTLDGQDVRELTVRTLREHVALVLQEPIMFSATIRENIAYGRPDASMGEIVEAAKAANAHDFISKLPGGYNAEVGQRGAHLSGGERQRISVARAFLKDAPVLVLDEPTSSIDSRTEAVILDALDRLIVGRTTFIIAHRLSTLRRADQILVVDGGRIVEQGTHAELLIHGGLYAELYRLQTAPRRENAEADKLATVSKLS